MSNVDRTKLNLVLANLVYDAVADPTLRANVFSEIYDLLALRAAETDVLLKSNTTAYTPAQPNNPSTKQYVDDQIVSQTIIKTNTTPFTPTQPYHPIVKKYVDDALVSIVAGTLPQGSVGTQYLTDGAVTLQKLSTDRQTASTGGQIYAYKNFGGL